jgi:hypothetical protein
MEDKPEVSFNADGDSLADATELADGAALDGSDGRVRCSQDENASQTNAFQGLAEDARFKGVEVGGDVGQFRH